MTRAKYLSINRLLFKLKVLFQFALLLSLPFLYENCARSPLGGDGNQSTLASNGSGFTLTSCNNAVLQTVYQNTYYQFLRGHACALCHESAGPGPAMASDDLAQGYSIFQVAPGQFLNSVLNSNAVNPDHHGAGSPNNQSQISAISATWNAALTANCGSAQNTPPEGNLAYKYLLSPKVVNSAPGAVTTLTWNIASDVSPASPVPATGVTLSATITAAQTTDIQNGYTISTILISTTGTGIKISGAKVQVNGQIYTYGTTFINSVADMPAPVDSYPLSIGSIFVPMTPTAGDTFSLNLGGIDLPTVAVNYQMPPGGPPTFSQPYAKFSELAAPGGPFANYCVQCHNPVFTSGHLNILDYTSVMQFVTPGLYNTHGGPLSPMISLIEGSGTNVMPPKGQLPYYDIFLNPFISWFNGGGLNN